MKIINFTSGIKINSMKDKISLLLCIINIPEKKAGFRFDIMLKIIQ